MAEKKELQFLLTPQLKLMMNKNTFLIKLSEIYPIGKFKYAPGTIASLFTCIIFFYLNTYFDIKVLIFLLFIFFGLSIISINCYLKKYGYKDHRSIVIDELVGQYVALMSIPMFNLENNLINIFIIFIIFRFFDISKIGLRSIEKLPGTIGILFDDIIGGIYSIPIIYLIFI